MKKGFTLIELLAVIVILAIIALIATPIVLSIIEETKESAVLRSAEHYLSAVEQSVMKKNLTAGENFSPNTCEVQSDGNLLCDGTEMLEIEVNGETPSSGTITFEKGKIIAVELTQANKTIIKNEKGELILEESNPKVCKITLDEDNDGEADTGDMITCSTESFHVISNENGIISMLSQYNLDVGQIYDDDTGEYEEIKNPTGIQSSDAKGYNEDSSIRYGVLLFSTTKYWYDYDNRTYIVDSNYKSEGREYPFVYGDFKDVNGEQQNLIYQYVKAYEEYLKKENVKSAEATLISYEQLIKLGCDGEMHLCSEENDWVYTTSYWGGSAAGASVLQVYSDMLFIFEGYSVNDLFGVRPVVNISTNELQ